MTARTSTLPMVTWTVGGAAAECRGESVCKLDVAARAGPVRRATSGPNRAIFVRRSQEVTRSDLAVCRQAKEKTSAAGKPFPSTAVLAPGPASADRQLPDRRSPVASLRARENYLPSGRTVASRLRRMFSIIGVGANIGSKFGLTIGATPNARSAMREKKSAIFHPIEIELPTCGAHRQDIGFAPAVRPG